LDIILKVSNEIYIAITKLIKVAFSVAEGVSFVYVILCVGYIDLTLSKITILDLACAPLIKTFSRRETSHPLAVITT